MSFLRFRRKDNCEGGNEAAHINKEGSSLVLQKASKSNVIKLLKRLESCTSARETRETLADLRSIPSLSEVVEVENIRVFFAILNSYSSDDDMLLSTFRLLSVLVTHLVSENPSERIADTKSKAQRQAVLSELIEGASLFLDALEGATVETQRCCAQILCQLVEYDYTSIRKVFFSPHVCTKIVELGTSFREKLQSECLQLLLLLTTADNELQNLFGRSKSFERFFQFVKDSGGIRGSSDVTDALTVVQNIMKDNIDAQEEFLSSGALSVFRELLDSVITPLKKEWKINGDKGTLGLVIENEDMSNNIVGCLRILTFLLSVSNRDSANEVRRQLISVGVFESVASLALSGTAVNDVVSIAALRCLADLLTLHEEAISIFLGFDVISVTNDSSHHLVIWPAARALLENVIVDNSDPSLLDGTLLVFSSLLTLDRCVEAASAALLCGVPNYKGHVGAYLDTGQVLLEVLFGSKLKSVSKYYGGHLLRMLATHSLSATKLISLLVHRNNLSSNLGPVSGLFKEKETVLFFDLFVEFTINTLQTCSMSTATLSAYIGSLIFFLKHSTALSSFQSHPRWYKALLQLASSEGSVHVRFWCGAVAAFLSVKCNNESKDSLHQQLEEHLGGVNFFNNILFDLKASTNEWDKPYASPFACGHPIIYDQVFAKELCECIAEYKAAFPNEVVQGKIVSGGSEKKNWEHSVPMASDNLACCCTTPSTDSPNLFAIEELKLEIVRQKSLVSEKTEEVVSLLKENQKLRALVEENETKLINALNVQKKDHVGDTSAQHDKNVKELEETIRFLEEELLAKQVENRQLVETVREMEKRFNQFIDPVPLQKQIQELNSRLSETATSRDELLVLLGHVLCGAEKTLDASEIL